MLAISDNVMTAFSTKAEDKFLAHLFAWIHGRPELQPHASVATPDWCRQTLHMARGWALDLEESVFWIARFRLTRGDGWFATPPVEEILHSDRDPELKIFQLKVLTGDAAHG